jgi:hypothetical protein
VERADYRQRLDLTRAPRSMNMGIIASPWRDDAAARWGAPIA